jgi:hypothetical protein
LGAGACGSGLPPGLPAPRCQSGRRQLTARRANLKHTTR